MNIMFTPLEMLEKSMEHNIYMSLSKALHWCKVMTICTINYSRMNTLTICLLWKGFIITHNDVSSVACQDTCIQQFE